jgi:hypothetical protein
VFEDLHTNTTLEIVIFENQRPERGDCGRFLHHVSLSGDFNGCPLPEVKSIPICIEQP